MASATSTSANTAGAPKAITRKEPDSNESRGVNVHVVVRCRPLNGQEKKDGERAVVSCPPKKREVIVTQGTSSTGKAATKNYNFDNVYGPEASQAELYEQTVAPIVEEVLKGFNCTIFAYGQTGTGKTFTMEGAHQGENAGVIPRAIAHIFSSLENSGNEYTVHVSYMELYNEEIFDLLSSEQKTLRIFEDNTGRQKGVTVQGLEDVIVHNVSDIMQVLETAAVKRQVAETNLNKASSRSHAIFSITLHTKESTPEGEDLLKVGKLNLVDLAGSENIGRSGAKDKRQREAGMINTSLLTLGRVITALVEHSPHVPYRESKLTRLLQESLGGRTKTCIIATITPSTGAVEETLSTLDYAYRARTIKNKPEVNQKMTKRSLIKEYTVEIERLRSQLNAARTGTGFYMPTEMYEELNQSLQSQKEKVVELETAIGQKEKELAEQIQLFQSKQAALEETEARLNETSAALSNTKTVLKTTETKLEQHVALVNAFEVTEEKLHQSTAEMQKVIADAVASVKGLERKVERQQSLFEEHKRKGSDFHHQVHQKLVSYEQSLDAFSTAHLDRLARAERQTTAFLESKHAELVAIDAVVAELHLRAASGYAKLQETVTSHTAERIEAPLTSFETAVAHQQAAAAATVADFTQSALISLQALKTQQEEQLKQLEAWAASTRDARTAAIKQHEQFRALQETLLTDLSNAVGAAAFAQNARLLQERESIAALSAKHSADAEAFKNSLLSQMTTLVGQFVAAQQQGIASITRTADTLLTSTGKDLNSLHQDVDTRVSAIRKEGVSYLATVTDASAAESKQLDAHLQQSVSSVGATQEHTAKLFRAVESVSKQSQSEQKALEQTVSQHVFTQRENASSFKSSHVAALQHEAKQLSGYKDTLAQKIDSTATSVTKMVAVSSKENSAAQSETSSFVSHQAEQVKGVEEDLSKHFGSFKDYTPTGETPMKKSFKTAYDLPRKVKETIPFRDITNSN